MQYIKIMFARHYSGKKPLHIDDLISVASEDIFRYVDEFGKKDVYENLEAAYLDGNNKKARENMLLASYYAGVAINNNFIGYVHAIAHGIGGLYGVTHGKANAIILPYVLEAFGEKSYKKLADLADLVGLT